MMDWPAEKMVRSTFDLDNGFYQVEFAAELHHLLKFGQQSNCCTIRDLCREWRALPVLFRECSKQYCQTERQIMYFHRLIAWVSVFKTGIDHLKSLRQNNFYIFSEWCTSRPFKIYFWVAEGKVSRPRCHSNWYLSIRETFKNYSCACEGSIKS